MLPWVSVAITVKVCGPTVAVSRLAPFGTAPTQEETPEGSEQL